MTDITDPSPRCIVQAGIRYCEDTAPTAHEIAFVILAALAITGWLIRTMWLIGHRRYREAVAFYFGPPLILAVYLLTRGA